MVSNRVIILLVVLLTILNASCERENPNSMHNVFYPDGIEDWELYNYDTKMHEYFPKYGNGSEFYYYNTHWNRIDTERVYNARYQPSVAYPGNGYKYDRYRVTYQGNGYGYTITIQPEFDNNDSLMTVMTIERAPSSSAIFFKDGNYLFNEHLSILDSVDVLGETYYDVLQFENQDLFFKRIWFAKDLGIIHRQHFNGTSSYVQGRLIK